MVDRVVDLATDVRFVEGVGPGRAAEFAKLGVHSVGDLVELIPFRHQHLPKSQPIGTLQLNAVATVVGGVERIRNRPSRNGKVVTARIVDGTGWCRVRWFHSPFLLDKLREGQVARITGKVDAFNDRASFTNPRLTIIDEGIDPLGDDIDRYEGVYPGTANLPGRQVARIVGHALDQVADQLVDVLPSELRARRRLPPRRTAILRCHRPTHQNDVAVARRRLAYEELLLCQLAVQLSRRRNTRGPDAVPMHVSDEIDRRIRRRFPFALTAGQDGAIAEIRADLGRTTPMNRLLQAEVGAGKTAVAVYAALAAVANRQRVAFLAPTEVLASQHYAKIERYLLGSRVRLGYLAGSVRQPRRRRSDALEALENGQMDIVVGTHALLEDDVRIPELGLVIIDEQHRFGVAQRARLRRKGTAPHTLVLTATPIPRTLAMTVFGDLDVSTITGTLPGRQEVVTKLVPAERMEDAWRFVRQRLAEGERAYVVYPLVEESDALPLKAASREVESLARTALHGFRLGLLHGRMKAAEKASVMDRFRRGDVQVLVSTTVIEVGVDVPEATVMVVQHAQRYGLSQLHQLRGRVGRSGRKSYCLLIAESTGVSVEGPAKRDEMPDAFAGRMSEAALARLDILCQTSDGFSIAEEDLRLRGPGEMLGTRQHGMPAFKFADLMEDFSLLTEARNDAAALLQSDPQLAGPDHQLLKDAVLNRYADVLGLIDIA